jgi:hypothetical protein
VLSANFHQFIQARIADLFSSSANSMRRASLRFTLQSVCILVNAVQSEAEKLLVRGRTNGIRYDEP